MNGNVIYENKYAENRPVELIIKYNGDISYLSEIMDVSIDILSNTFAILTLNSSDINKLYDIKEIIYIEFPKNLRLFLESSLTDSCLTEGFNIPSDLNGSGVLVGIIDSGIRDNLPFNDNIKCRLMLNDNRNTDHGTMVASIINRIAPSADIAFVAIGNNEFFASDTDIMRGINYITQCADGRPFVINISYGTNSGPHDGNTLFEEYIDQVAQSYVCSIIVATGNEGNKGRHYSGELNEIQEIEFNVDAGLKSSVIEVWKNFTDKVCYKIVAPNGAESSIINSSSKEIRISLADSTVYFIFTEPSPYNINEQVYIRIESDSFINRGIWKLYLYPQNIVQGNYNIWSNNVTFLNPDIYTTLTIPSTANRVLSVGAYNSLTNAQTDFSGRGYTVNNAVKPDIVAPGVNVFVNNIENTGTSVAAPFVSGSAALLLQWGIVNRNDINLYGERLKAYFRLGATRDVGMYPNRTFGYGRLCFSNILNQFKSITICANGESPFYNNNYEEFILPTDYDLSDYLEANNITYCDVTTGNYKVLYANRENYMFLNTIKEVFNCLRESSATLMGLMDEKLNISANIALVQRPPLDLTGREVVVGFVDTGINYTNPEFLYDNGDNRIYSIWDMTKEDETSEGVCFGRVYTNEEITAQTADTNDTNGHGTAMAIQACGNSGAAPDSIIVAVKLKKAKKYLYEREFVDEDVDAYSSIDVVLGIDYIIREANKLKRPVVIILGLGTNQGGHDGSSILERYMEHLGTIASRIVVAPTGNEALAKHHASVNVDTDNGYVDVEISVSENVRGFNLWIWNSIRDKVEVSIISPIGESINRIPAQNSFSNEYVLFQTNSRVNVNYAFPVFQTLDQRTTISFRNPLAGVWIVRIYASTNDTINLWLPITQFIGDNVTFLTPDAYSTVTVPATAGNVMTVGAYNVDDNNMLPQSGRGPNRLNELKPYFAAPSYTNTSIAAAVAGGAAALLMQWGIINGNFYSMNTLTATALIINSTKQNPNDIYPNNISGYGQIDLYNVFFKI